MARIYDVQMYSEGDGELIVDLEPQRREQAATSGTGLLWDGTARPGKENSCSYGQRMAELKSAAVASDGKPRLHAPRLLMRQFHYPCSYGGGGYHGISLSVSKGHGPESWHAKGHGLGS